jgi:hypothetical protein
VAEVVELRKDDREALANCEWRRLLQDRFVQMLQVVLAVPQRQLSRLLHVRVPAHGRDRARDSEHRKQVEPRRRQEHLREERLKGRA